MYDNNSYTISELYPINNDTIGVYCNAILIDSHDNAIDVELKVDSFGICAYHLNNSNAAVFHIIPENGIKLLTELKKGDIVNALCGAIDNTKK